MERSREHVFSHVRFFTDNLFQGEPIQDPFRRGIGQAIQWYDTLRRRLEAMVELAIDDAHSHIATTEATEAQRLASPRESTHRIRQLEAYVHDMTKLARL